MSSKGTPLVKAMENAILRMSWPAGLMADLSAVTMALVSQ